MSHLILHPTRNLDGFDADAALAAANRALVDSGHFADIAITRRALPLDRDLIGNSDDGHGFVHATQKVMPGRSGAVRAALGRDVHDALVPYLPTLDLHCQLCVEGVALQAATYIKRTHARSAVPETHP